MEGRFAKSFLWFQEFCFYSISFKLLNSVSFFFLLVSHCSFLLVGFSFVKDLDQKLMLILGNLLSKLPLAIVNVDTR